MGKKLSKKDRVIILSREILDDIIDDKIKLSKILLKASELSSLLDIEKNINLFKTWSKDAEYKEFILNTYSSDMKAAQDPSFSINSANPNQFVSPYLGNYQERQGLRTNASTSVSVLSAYRTETYNFVLGVHNKWKFGSISEAIFENKRKETDSLLNKYFPDSKDLLKSISENITSTNPKSWKAAVTLCRSLLMDIADIVKLPEDKNSQINYINIIKNFISPKIKSETKRKLIKTELEELKKRIECVSDLTQGSAHKDSPLKRQAEDVIIHTYLVLCDIMQLYDEREQHKTKKIEKPAKK